MPQNAGCWLQDSPAPLLPCTNITGGKVPPREANASASPEGFEPVGHAFRNRSAVSPLAIPVACDF